MDALDELGGDSRIQVDDPVARQDAVEDGGRRPVACLLASVQSAASKFLDAAVEAAQRVGRAPRPDVLGRGTAPPLLRCQGA